MPSDERIKLLKDDLRNAYEIMLKMGDFWCKDPDVSMKERTMYYMSRAIYDILEHILRELGEW